MLNRKFTALGFALAAPVALMIASTSAQAQAPEYQAQTAASSDENLERLNARANDVVAALNQEMPIEDVFHENFLKQVPIAQLTALTVQLSAQFGDLIGVESVTPVGSNGAAEIVLRFEKALGNGSMQLSPDAPHKIVGLLLTDFEPLGNDVPSILEEVSALPGNASIYFAKLDGSAPLLAVNEAEHFAIGSTFKLYVLSALTRSIAAGEHRWDEVVQLDQKSFASGQLQNWPQGTPLTLQSLATLMISISDNTATDQLMQVVGREAVDAEVVASGHSNPALTLPFLTTREMFVLKAVGGDALENYVGSSETERQAILQTLVSRRIDGREVQSTFAAGPKNIDVEWLASGQDIAGIFRRIAETEDQIALTLMGVNTSMTQGNRENWDYVGYKGGSEPGVLNLSWLLRDRAGEYYTLVMSWNDPDETLEHTRFELLSGRALAAMAALVD